MQSWGWNGSRDKIQGWIDQRRNLRKRRLGGDLVQAPEKAAADDREDGERVELGLALAHRIGVVLPA